MEIKSIRVVSVPLLAFSMPSLVNTRLARVEYHQRLK